VSFYPLGFDGIARSCFFGFYGEIFLGGEFVGFAGNLVKNAWFERGF
jgi:hypothetical protein